ncbi:tRNA (guanine-N(7)-)-methyltransferase non-catalytic subunit [Elysia marginata]|uniref:tRNA (Guanine-N(7)-)-methyltransferase non-catalytic subunit n=1 Tax=Elysia marginata TaxID=1093978 RepID=A0AAV4FJP4_9GAST|nr:tRNA (guanine-N(7)-)-methyltransferase non-catalytic subunit [Elysia marginata]
MNLMFQYLFIFLRCTARRCTDVCFSPDDSLVLVADKSGDAYSFPALSHQRGNTSAQGQGEGLCQSHQQKTVESAAENDNEDREDESDVKGEKGEDREADEEGEEELVGGDGTLVLGHLSMLLGVMLVDDGRKIVTCDRDEKIRISRFPDAYNIHAYCLGHTEVMAPRAANASLTSLPYCAHGVVTAARQDTLRLDCTVRVWSLEGREICSRNVLTDLPTDDRSIRTSPPIATEDKAAKDRQNLQATDNTNRPTIRQMSYCHQCSLLFVAMESASGDQLDAAQEKCESGRVVASVSGLCLQDGRLWLLRQLSDKLSLAAYTICLGSDKEVKILPVRAESKESQVVNTVSQQDNFLEAQSAAEDLLPFLWKSNFQDDFKLQCNLKRGSKVEDDSATTDNKKGRGKKKAKIGENGR